MLSSVPLRRANKFIFLKNTLWSSGGGLIDNLFIFLDGFQQGQTDILHPGRQPRKTSSTRIRIEQTESCNYNDRWASLGNHHQRESRTDKTDSCKYSDRRLFGNHKYYQRESKVLQSFLFFLISFDMI